MADAVTVVNSSATLTADVTVGAGNPSREVDWTAESGGSVSPVRGTTTTFHAPSIPGKYKITATSVADSNKHDSAYVVVVWAPDTWRLKSTIPNRTPIRSAQGIHGKVYALGVDTLYSYDPANDAWNTLAAPPVGYFRFTGTLNNSTMYAFTAVSVPGTWKCDQYNVWSDSWSSCASPAFGSPFFLGAVQGHLYALDSTTFFDYDPLLGDWTSHTFSNYQGSHYAAATWGGYVYAFGGSNYNPKDSAEMFNPFSYEWTQAAFPGRGTHASATATVADRIHVLGAYYLPSDQIGDANLMYDPAANNWTLATPMPTPRFDFSAAQVDGQIYTLGGTTEGPPDTPGIARATPTYDVHEYSPPGVAGILSVVVGDGPFGISFDGSYMWVANAKTSRVSKIRISDASVRAIYTTGSNPRGSLALDGRYIWVTAYDGGTVTRVRTSDGATDTYSGFSSPHGAVFDGTNVWVANYGNNTVTKLRASDGYKLGTFTVGSGPTGVAFDGSNIWVSTRTEITKLNTTGARIGAFTPVDTPYGLTFDGASLWFANYGANTVTKLRPSDGAHLGTFPVGRGPMGIAVTGSSVWVTNTGDDTVTELRASDGATICTLKTGSSPYGVAYAEGHPWVTNYGSNDVRRLY